MKLLVTALLILFIQTGAALAAEGMWLVEVTTTGDAKGGFSSASANFKAGSGGMIPVFISPEYAWGTIMISIMPGMTDRSGKIGDPTVDYQIFQTVDTPPFQRVIFSCDQPLVLGKDMQLLKSSAATVSVKISPQEEKKPE